MTSRGDELRGRGGTVPSSCSGDVSWEGGTDVHTIRVLRLRGMIWLDMCWGEGHVWTRVPEREWVRFIVWGDACCLLADRGSKALALQIPTSYNTSRTTSARSGALSDR